MIDLPTNVETVSKIKLMGTKEGNASKLINLSISGAHAYGFASADSDIDWRGCYIIKTEVLHGLRRAREEVRANFDAQNDIVLTELGKLLGHAVRSNCTTLEQIFEKQVETSREFFELRNLMQETMAKGGLYDSYKGMATFNYKKFILSGQKNSIKKYLYVLRGLMSGIYTLRHGAIEPNINEVNSKEFNNPLVTTLVDMKVNGREWQQFDPKMDEQKVRALINELFTMMDDAYQKSQLPPKASDDSLRKVDLWLKRLRRENLDD